LKDQKWLDDEKTRAKSYSAKYLAINKENPSRFDVSLYPRVVKQLDPLSSCECGLTLKDALTVAVTERVLERKQAPSIDTELAEIRNCHFLSRVAFDVDRVKDICRIRMVQLRYPHWNGKSREFRKLWERMEEGVKEF